MGKYHGASWRICVEVRAQYDAAAAAAAAAAADVIAVPAASHVSYRIQRQEARTRIKGGESLGESWPNGRIVS